MRHELTVLPIFISFIKNVCTGFFYSTDATNFRGKCTIKLYYHTHLYFTSVIFCSILLFK